MSDRGSRSGEQGRYGIVERLRSLFGSETASVRDDIKDALDDSTKEDLSVQELSMLRSVLGLHELRVRDIMVPRADIISVELNDSLFDVLTVFRTAGHSRLPVHGQTLDDPRGMVHIRDFVDYLATQAQHPTSRDAVAADGSEGESASQTANFGLVDLTVTLEKANIARPVLFVPPSMLVLDLLVKMQAERTHMALVIDEYGGTDGLVSIEDVVEVIVGDIEDEHDDEETPSIEASGDGTLIADARASLGDLVEKLSLAPDIFEKVDDVDTIGGLVGTVAGRVPLRGEVIVSEAGLEFEILDADPRRVKRVRIKKIETESPIQD
ncbi:MAG: HlyC/CorC family transporter [Hyphomicrobiales bacterium]|nr:HlyC/CorC family transporter [Hyphomicrobiales bacterium]